MKHAVSFAFYVGIGALLHYLFVGETIDWSSAWSLGWVFGWPLMFFITFWSAIVILAVVCGIGFAVYLWIESFTEWRERRRRARG